MVKTEEPSAVKLTYETATKAEDFDKLLEEYKKKLETINDIETLKEEAKRVEAEADEYNKTIVTKVYNLPESVEFEGKNITKSTVVSNIIYFLNKQEVAWQYVLGMHQLVQFWSKKPEEITYGAFDSTLRLLGQGKYIGSREWTDILAINAYFAQCNEEYKLDLARQMYHASMVNAVCDRYDLISPVKSSDKKE